MSRVSEVRGFGGPCDSGPLRNQGWVGGVQSTGSGHRLRVRSLERFVDGRAWVSYHDTDTTTQGLGGTDGRIGVTGNRQTTFLGRDDRRGSGGSPGRRRRWKRSSGVGWGGVGRGRGPSCRGVELASTVRSRGGGRARKSYFQIPKEETTRTTWVWDVGSTGHKDHTDPDSPQGPTRGPTRQ